MATRSASASTRKRRTQAERRAATRTALLDAAIECLVEEGYAKTTTRRIAERAGVSPGTVQYHFTSKAQLLGETRRHITTKWTDEILARAPADAPSIEARNEELLDIAWELYKGPYFQATLELLVAARTDPALRGTGVEAMRHVTRSNEFSAAILYPELAERPGLAELLATGQATMRGLALVTFGNDADPDAAWPATRAHILALGAQVLGDPELST
jgi:AcrR family transcriptional regulator